MDSLHPEVKRVASIVLDGDIDAALKTVYASMDSRARSIVGAKGSESTVSLIGKAFNDRTLVPPNAQHKDSARNFLQGVLGYYRSSIVHNPTPSHRNTVDASLSLFGLAHEAFLLLDRCDQRSEVSKI